jgi:hypothetical protein
MEELGQSLRNYSGFVVQWQAADMIVELPSGGGRRHAVKVQTWRLPGTSVHALRLQARAALVSEPSMIRKALKENAGMADVGFALDASVDPPSLDVVYGLIAEGATVSELVDALVKVAFAASVVDSRIASGHRL